MKYAAFTAALLAITSVWAADGERHPHESFTISSPIPPNKYIGIDVNESNPITEYTAVRIDSPSITICLLRIGEECVLEYNGKSQQFTARRTWNVKVGPDQQKR